MDNIRKELTTLLHEGKIKTEGDLEDYAFLKGLSLGYVEKLIAEICLEGTSCKGCKHIMFALTGMYPCNSCSRRKEDLYEKEA